jgi:hypothetical protein
MKQFISLLTIFFFLLLFPIEVFASHSIILKSGQTIKGTVINQNEKGLTVKLGNGSSQTIEKNKILKVVYKDISEEEETKIRIEEDKKVAEKNRIEEEKRKKLQESDDKKQAIQNEKNRIEDEKKKLADDKLKEEKFKKESELREKARREGSRKLSSVMWRSAILPGWGLFHANRPVAGTIYSSLFAGTVLYALTANSKVKSAKSKYEQDSLFYQVLRPDPINYLNSGGIDYGSYYVVDKVFSDNVAKSKNEFKSKANMYNGALGAAVLVYFIQLTHSYIAGKNWVEEEFLTQGKQSGFDLESRWETAGVSWEFRTDMGYTWRF